MSQENSTVPNVRPEQLAGVEEWYDPTSIFRMEAEQVDIQIIGEPTTPYVLEKSLNGVDFSPVRVLRQGGQQVSDFATEGHYWTIGRGFYRFSAGAGSTIFTCVK